MWCCACNEWCPVSELRSVDSKWRDGRASFPQASHREENEVQPLGIRHLILSTRDPTVLSPCTQDMFVPFKAVSPLEMHA